MSPLEQLQDIEPAGQTIVTVRRRLMDGRVEPALNIRPANMPHETDSGGGSGGKTEHFLIEEPDSFYEHNRIIGVFGLTHVVDAPDHLEAFIQDGAIEEPQELRSAVEGLMEEEGVSEVIINASDTNLSQEALRRAGATALSQDTLEFHLAA